MNKKEPDFKERLAQELQELDRKISLLEHFMRSAQFEEIDPVQMSLLNIQHQAMLTYSQILLERIVRL